MKPDAMPTDTGRKPKAVKLIPPDKKRCQAMKKEGCHPDAEHFMVHGPGRFVRCTKAPTVIAYENKPAADGLKGSMSLCDECLELYLKAFPPGHSTIKKLTQPRA